MENQTYWIFLTKEELANITNNKIIKITDDENKLDLRITLDEDRKRKKRTTRNVTYLGNDEYEIEYLDKELEKEMNKLTHEEQLCEAGFHKTTNGDGICIRCGKKEGKTQAKEIDKKIVFFNKWK